VSFKVIVGEAGSVCSSVVQCLPSMHEPRVQSKYYFITISISLLNVEFNTFVLQNYGI
jgi:hypothetical protein